MLGSPEGSIVSRASTFGVGFLLAITLLVGALQENRLFPWSNSKPSTWYVSHYNLFRFEGTVLTTDRSLMSIWEVILLLHRSSRLVVHVRTRKIKNSHTWWARWNTFQHTDLSTWYVNRYNSFRFYKIRLHSSRLASHPCTGVFLPQSHRTKTYERYVYVLVLRRFFVRGMEGVYLTIIRRRNCGVATATNGKSSSMDRCWVK